MKLPKAQEIINSTGIGPDGDVQRFHTQNVLRHLIPYMWYKSGAAIKKMIAATDINKPLIVLPGPESRMLYYGKVMIDPVINAAGFFDPKTGQWYSRKGSTKVPTDRDLNFNTEKNPLAGPFPDKRLVADKGAVLTGELQSYIDKKGGTG